MKISRRRRTRRSGFTLTEMLIVLAILVMLMALVVPRFLGARKKADLQATQAQVGLFRGALESYALDTKDFPTTEQGLQALLAAPGDGEEGSVVGWDGPYVNKDTIGLDPWNHDYQYAYPPERGKTDLPDIWSFGPDGEDNTEDDICSWTVTAGEEGAEGAAQGESGHRRRCQLGGPAAPRQTGTGPSSAPRPLVSSEISERQAQPPVPDSPQHRWLRLPLTRHLTVVSRTMPGILRTIAPGKPGHSRMPGLAEFRNVTVQAAIGVTVRVRATRAEGDLVWLALPFYLRQICRRPDVALPAATPYGARVHPGGTADRRGPAGPDPLAQSPVVAEAVRQERVAKCRSATAGDFAGIAIGGHRVGKPDLLPLSAGRGQLRGRARVKAVRPFHQADEQPIVRRTQPPDSGAAAADEATQPQMLPRGVRFAEPLTDRQLRHACGRQRSVGR